MKRLVTASGLLALASACSPAPAPAPPSASASGPVPARAAASPYPVAPHADLVETVAGVTVRDPFRPLEALDAPATRAWVAAENQLTDRVLAALPAREPFTRSLTELATLTANGAPVVRGDRWFWMHDDGHSPQHVLVTAQGPNGAPTTLVDPNVLSPDGTQSFSSFVVSHDGSRVAYGLADGGGDWTTWHLRDVRTGKDLTDALPHTKYYAPQLTRDGKVVFYSRFPAPAAGHELSEPDHDHKVYRHVVGTPVSADTVVYERPDHPSWQFRPFLTDDDRYLVVETGDGEVGDRSEEQLHVVDLGKPGAAPVAVAGDFGAEHLFVGNEGATLFVKTSDHAPNRRIVAVDLKSPARTSWRDVVPETKDNIDSATLAGKRLLVSYVHDAHSVIAAHDLAGKKLGDVALPGFGKVILGSGGALTYESFARPKTAYRYDAATGALAAFRPAPLPFDPDALETTLFFYPGKDGTKIPLSLTGTKGRARDAATPTLLTGYGVGGVPYLPRYQAFTQAWLAHGGQLAVANVRGGGEYGDAWRLAGSRARKQVTHDDFIAAAEWLAREKITSSKHLGIFGRSGGGLLVGAVLVQRPDLFGAVMPIVGVHDLMRFHLFGEGAGWSGFLGSPADPADAPFLHANSPLHNVKAGTHYPPTYLVTSDHDVRVAPLHSYKLAAALQQAQAGDAPILLRVTTGGHGGATTRAGKVATDAEQLAFFARYLD